MPQKIKCEGCGLILYNDIDLKPPSEIIKQLNNSCPRCAKELVFDPKKVEINPS